MMTPATEQELSDAIRETAEPFKIAGGGTRGIGKPMTGKTLSMTGLSGIELYDPGALTLVAKAGTPLRDIETALGAENQRLAFEPPDYRGLLGTKGTSTIGGVAATNASGPRRIQVGACRDHMLGVRFVDGSGAIVKNGGRVMKNVTGYDLVKLLAGSYGTLGVLSEVSFKVLPDVDQCSVLLINGLSDTDAIKALSVGLGSPFDVTGAAHTPKGIDGHPVTMLRLEGFASSVDYRVAELSKLLGGFGEITVESDREKTSAGWRWVRDVEAFHGQDGDVWRISVKPTDGPEAARQIGTGQVLYDWGGGLVWALVPSGTDVRARLANLGGHATLVRGTVETCMALPVFSPEPAPLARITAGIKKKFDPRHILNPGLMA